MAEPPQVRELAALPAVAREAIAARLEQRAAREVAAAVGALATPAPVFVTLRIDGDLRGCIGDLRARCADLVAEVADRAVAAAVADPRFDPLTRAELDRITISVSVLGPLQRIRSVAELDPARFGVVVVAADGRRGVLLPGLDGVDAPERQVAIARRKGRIGEEEPAVLFRFETVTVDEQAPA